MKQKDEYLINILWSIYMDKRLCLHIAKQYIYILFTHMYLKKLRYVRYEAERRVSHSDLFKHKDG